MMVCLRRQANRCNLLAFPLTNSVRIHCALIMTTFLIPSHHWPSFQMTAARGSHVLEAYSWDNHGHSSSHTPQPTRQTILMALLSKPIYSLTLFPQTLHYTGPSCHLSYIPTTCSTCSILLALPLHTSCLHSSYSNP